jgi:hypothetical protein
VAEHGVADRKSASSHPRLIYAHFASKENSFALPLGRERTAMPEIDLIDANDFPGWLGGLFSFGTAALIVQAGVRAAAAISFVDTGHRDAAGP